MNQSAVEENTNTRRPPTGPNHDRFGLISKRFLNQKSAKSLTKQTRISLMISKHNLIRHLITLAVIARMGLPHFCLNDSHKGRNQKFG